jgi:tRNA uridine 5-carboxymethylaminomethyl modification enzyme
MKFNLDGQRRSAYELLSYPDYSIQSLRMFGQKLTDTIDSKVAEALEIDATYSVYMDRQTSDIASIQVAKKAGYSRGLRL